MTHTKTQSYIPHSRTSNPHTHPYARNGPNYAKYALARSTPSRLILWITMLQSAIGLRRSTWRTPPWLRYRPPACLSSKLACVGAAHTNFLFAPSLVGTPQIQYALTQGLFIQAPRSLHPLLPRPNPERAQAGGPQRSSVLAPPPVTLLRPYTPSNAWAFRKNILVCAIIQCWQTNIC